MSLRAWLLITLASTIPLAALTTSARAGPAAYFSWDLGSSMLQCDPSVSDVAIPGDYDRLLGIAVLGLNSAYSGFDLELAMTPLESGAFPDAWRFDPGGCQGPSRQWISYSPPPIESACHYLGSPDGNFAATFSEVFDRPSKTLQFITSLRWSTPAASPDPLCWYWLFGLGFHHGSSVSGPSRPHGGCGGVEKPMCFRLTHLSLAGPDGGTLALVAIPPAVSANAAAFGGASACLATPARPSTWGAIKQQYR